MRTQTIKIKVYYHCQDKKEIASLKSKDVRIEEVTIGDAYFGKYSGPSLRDCPWGLQLSLNKEDFGSVPDSHLTYTNLKDIEGLMTDLRASRTEELKGKKVLAHAKGPFFVGLSALLE